jgi:hypothetical protein
MCIEMVSSNNSSKAKIKNIVTVDIYSHVNYVFKNDVLNTLVKLVYNTSNFVTSYLSNKDIISTSIKLSRSIPEEDIAYTIDIKAYEELGLDHAISYMISYVESDNEGQERKFHIFVSESSVLDRKFLPVKEKTKYVDLILPAPLLFKSLYKKEILPQNNTHCFIYFTKNDAFITLYKNGEYIYSKSIEYSLDQIYNKYCEIVGERVDEDEFFSLFKSEGLKVTNSEFQQNLMKIFVEVFITINDIIIYAKRAFKLSGIDHIFIGSQKGTILALDDYCQNYLGLNSSELNFDYELENDEQYTDQLHYLMLITTFDYLEDESNKVNLTMYTRAPSFVNRASGQFIITTFLAISFALAYPLMYLLGSYANDTKIYVLKKEDKVLSRESSKYKKILSVKKNEIKKLDNKRQKLESKYHGKTKTLTAIYDKKVNYKLKSGIYYMLAEELAKFNVNVDMLSSDGDDFRLSLISTEDRKFTEVIKYFSEKHFDEIKYIDIQRIEKNSEDDYYKGLLKMELK